MKTLLLTLLLSLFFATQVTAVQPTPSDEKLAMKNEIPEDTPDGESEDSLDDDKGDDQRKKSLESSSYPDGESEDESDDEAKEKKD